MSSYLNLVLYQPEIPQNTGNLIRLAANMGATLHLIHPLGFDLGEKAVRRAGLDYHALACVREYADYADFLNRQKQPSLYAFSTHGNKTYSTVRFQPGDYLMFGPETRGLPCSIREQMPPERVLRLPMVTDSRSINLSNTVAAAAYEAWRQMGFPGGG